jgi:hypothetical protein
MLDGIFGFESNGGVSRMKSGPPPMLVISRNINVLASNKN